jgi:hypothetical protein
MRFTLKQRLGLDQHEGVWPPNPPRPMVHREFGCVDLAMHVRPAVLSERPVEPRPGRIPKEGTQVSAQLAATAFLELDRPVVTGARRVGQSGFQDGATMGRDNVEACRAPVRRGSRPENRDGTTNNLVLAAQEPDRLIAHLGRANQ